MTVLQTWQRGPLCWAVFTRQEALNAINFEVMAALEALLDRLERDDDPTLVLILRGQGERAFASGGDLREFAALTSEADASAMASRMQAILSRLERLPILCLGAINGDAYGGGCELLAALDLRLAYREARLGFTQARFHLSPGWGGLTRLVHLVGRSTALRWLAQAAVVDAFEAQRAGFIDEILQADDLGAFDAQVEQLALSLSRHTSRQLIGALKSGAQRALALPYEEALAQETQPFSALWAGQTHHDRVAKFLARQDARSQEP